jgi:hypothetical protein
MKSKDMQGEWYHKLMDKWDACCNCDLHMEQMMLSAVFTTLVASYSPPSPTYIKQCMYSIARCQ